MSRRFVPALLALALVAGCAGPTKLAQRSEDKLAGGEHWRAWELATRALGKEPGNVRARAAAEAAGAAIATDWQRRIRALADVDSLAAAEQVLEFAEFRLGAVPYAAIAVPAEWSATEQGLRRTAARTHYQRGVAAMNSRRPKKAHLHFLDTERFVTEYRDAAALAERTLNKALARVAVAPFRAMSGNSSLGAEVASEWRNELARHLAPPVARFTRLMDGVAVEAQMTVAQLGRLSREDAVRLGRKAGAERIVWGEIGGVRSETSLHVFSDVIARRIVEKDAEGHTSTRWVEIPIEVVARVRDVVVPVEYEVIAVPGGASLARRRAERATSARVVWTSYAPVGDLGHYALVSETMRAANPERAKQVESRWKSVCGEQTTLRQVLEARVATRKSARYGREVLPRIIAGAAFVFLEDLPPAEDLAFAALARGWEPLREDLLRLDATDDVDLGVPMAGTGDR
jgi:hypothetical protein